MIGAGGSAAAVAAATQSWPGCEVRCRGALRRPRRCAGAAFRSRARGPDRARRVRRCRSCRQCDSGRTQLTTKCPCRSHELPHDAAVFDLVYRAAETRWVREARAAGHPATDGLAMLVEQGARSFVRWFGREPDRAAMWLAVSRRCGPRASLTEWRRRVAHAARAAAQASLDLAFPRACVLCDRQLDASDAPLVCRVCLACVARLPAPRCDRCGHPSPRDGVLLVRPPAALRPRRALRLLGSRRRRGRARPQVQVLRLASARDRDGARDGAAPVPARRRRGAIRGRSGAARGRSASASAATTRASSSPASWLERGACRFSRLSTAPAAPARRPG